MRIINEGGLEVVARLAQKESTDAATRVNLARTIFNLSRHGTCVRRLSLPVSVVGCH